MKKIILAIMLLGAELVYAETSFENELKNASSGSVSSRFKVGYSFGIGYQGRVGGDGDTKIQGLLLEGGLYGLFNPIRNFADIEVGANFKYNTGVTVTSGNSGDSTYYAGLKQATIYAGTVFRFGETGKALALGLSKALYIDEVQTDDLKDSNIKKHDLENGLGVYAEYQTDAIGGRITFVRVEVERIDVVGRYTTSEDTIASILFGTKF